MYDIPRTIWQKLGVALVGIIIAAIYVAVILFFKQFALDDDSNCGYTIHGEYECDQPSP